jgi:DNA invertase Pin-like site-specific DNA recombinase
LLNFCRAGDTICVVRLDRLGRSLEEALETVDMFKARGLTGRSLEQRLDTSSAAGELVFHSSALSNSERRLIV